MTTPNTPSIAYPILVTAQPKNGTHLLLNTLAHIPGLSEVKRPHINWARREEIFPALLSLKNGEFTKSHLIYSGKANNFMLEHNFRVFNMIRDPRDNLVSYLFYLKRSSNHRLHNVFTSQFNNDEERLMALIQGFHFTIDNKKHKVNAVDKPLMNWWKWNECRYCLPVRFENLVGEKGGGTEILQKNEVKKILQHLQLPADENVINEISANCFNTDTYSFRKGQIGEWKKYFSPQHKSAFKQIAQQALIHYQYETDDNW